MINYLIVGQGLAGTLIAGECIKRGLDFKVVDNPDLSKASKVAAGIINPITGRKFVKSWMYEELERVFVPTYKRFEELLGGSYLHPRTIIRGLRRVKDQNNWDARSLDEQNAEFMDSSPLPDEYQNQVHERIGYGKVPGYQLNVSALVNDFRLHLVKNEHYVQEQFDYEAVEILTSSITYKNLEAEAIIFCEGHKVADNPFFSHLPFTPAKGEALIVKIPSLETKLILKDHLFIVHLEDDLYWVGASYGWTEFSDVPTKEKKLWLLEGLDKILRVNYKLVDHIAGVRPATKYRKPLMGTHVDFPRLHLFNGLGTKGSSLGPYWSQHFMQHLEEKEILSDQVKI